MVIKGSRRMIELTSDDIYNVHGGVKLGRFLLDTLIGGLTGTIGGFLAGGPAGAATGFVVGAIGAATSDIASGHYDAHLARMDEQQRQSVLIQQNDEMIRFINA